MLKKALLAFPVAMAVGFSAHAAQWQDPADVLQTLLDDNPDSLYLHQSEQNIMMMPDNPALWLLDEGEALFYEKRGPKNASLEQCDFGKGPGVLKGAYVEMPRYFEDTDQVMDFESRLVHCMKNLQGFTDNDKVIAKKHGNGADITKLTLFVAYQSSGMPWNTPMDHPQERAMRDAGEKMFYRRAGIFDFSCATCHGEEGKRIRASVLQDVHNKAEWTKAVSWPAHRAGHDNVRSLYHRVRGCYWQMRQGLIKPGSRAQTAMLSFWADTARGQPAILPDLKR